MRKLITPVDLGMVVAVAMLLQSCDFGGIKEVHIGQLQAIDKLPHEFEVKVKELQFGTGTQLRQDFGCGDEVLGSNDVTISITNLGSKPIIVNGPNSAGMELGQIPPGEAKRVFAGKFGNLTPGFFIGTTGEEFLHYKLSLVFQKEQELKYPLRISLVWIPPSL
jgi:hypothetical protein